MLFSNPVSDASSTGQSIHMMDVNGNRVSSRWKTNDQNPRMLIFSAPAGRYTLVLDTSPKDAGWRPLEIKLSGAVYMR